MQNTKYKWVIAHSGRALTPWVDGDSNKLY